jgi:hypothetical protein
MLHTATFYHETIIDGHEVEAIFEITARIIPGEPAVTYGPADNWHPGSADKVDILDYRAMNFDEKHLVRIVDEYAADRSTENKPFEFESIDGDDWVPCFDDSDLDHAIEAQRKCNLFYL